MHCERLVQELTYGSQAKWRSETDRPAGASSIKSTAPGKERSQRLYSQHAVAKKERKKKEKKRRHHHTIDRSLARNSYSMICSDRKTHTKQTRPTNNLWRKLWEYAQTGFPRTHIYLRFGTALSCMNITKMHQSHEVLASYSEGMSGGRVSESASMDLTSRSSR